MRGRGVAMDAPHGHAALAFERAARLRAWMAALPQASAPSLDALVGPRARRLASEAWTTLCVVGGFLAAPLLTIVAFVGLALPGRAPLHHMATTLLLVAVVWLSLALVGAHVHHSRLAQGEAEADE